MQGHITELKRPQETIAHMTTCPCPNMVSATRISAEIATAASARCDAIRLVFSYVDEGKLLRTETETPDAGDNSQGISEPESADDTKWDWDEKTGWDSSEREKKPGELDAERAARTEALREELRERFIRAAEAVTENEARAARIAAEGAKRPVPDPSPAPFSGNIEPDLRGSVRIGGKLVALAIVVLSTCNLFSQAAQPQSAPAHKASNRGYTG